MNSELKKCWKRKMDGLMEAGEGVRGGNIIIHNETVLSNHYCIKVSDNVFIVLFIQYESFKGLIGK